MIINLDKLKEEREILKFGGEEHDVKDFTVEDFLEYSKKEKKGEFLSIVDSAVGLGEIICPTIDIKKLRTDQLSTIYEFFLSKLRGEIDEKKKQEVLKPQK